MTYQEQSKKNKIIIDPSILSCDFAQLGDQCQKLLDGGADWLHVDIMDGHFVPNISLGFPVISAIRKRLGEQVFLDCHFMISDPLKYVQEIAKSGTSQAIFHREVVSKQIQDAKSQIKKISEQLRAVGVKPALAVNPATPIDDAITESIANGYLDMILIMTVVPGFGGQQFQQQNLEKVRQLRQQFSNLNIGVDGGIKIHNSSKCVEAGANVISSGTGITSEKDWKLAIKTMRQNCQ